MKKIFLLLAFLLVAVKAEATTYWTSSSAVSTTLTDCDGDADPGVYCTFASIYSGMAGGDTLKGKAGTYDTRITTAPKVGPNSSQKTTITCETTADPPNGVAPVCIMRPVGAFSTVVLFSSSQNWSFQNWKFDLTGSTSSTVSPVFGVSNDTLNDNWELINNEFTAEGETAATSISMVNMQRNPNGLIRNNSIHGCATASSNPDCHGMYLSGSNATIENNLVYNVGRSGGNAYGIQYFNSGGIAFTGGVIRYNRVHTANRGILVGASNTGAEVYGNVVYNTTGTAGSSNGITARQTSGKVYNNTVHDAAGTGILIESNCSAAACTVRNNISIGNTTNCTVGSSTNSNNLCSGTDTSHFIDPDNATMASRNYNLIEGAASIAGGVQTGLPSGYTCVAAGSTCDQGAYQAPVRSGAVVEDATDTIYRITFSLPTQSTRDGTGLQTCTVGNIAVTVAGAGATESSCSTSASTSRVDVTLGAAVTVGQALTDAYTRTSLPTLKDNVNIGGTYAHVRTYSAAAGTNNVDGGALPAFTQTRYRFHKLRGTEASPSLLNAATTENVSVTLPPGAAFRLRVKFRTDDNPDATTFKLRYSKDAGAYTDIPDTISTDNIGWYGVTSDTDIPAAGSATTELLTSDEATNVACAVVRTSSDYPLLDFNNGESECEYVIKISTSATVGTTYDFRVYKGDNTALDTYSVTPRLTVGSYTSFGF